MKRRQVDVQKKQLKASKSSSSKKQPDFYKVKTKPGRHLPAGRNVTKTSFKSKKIQLPAASTESSVPESLDELLTMLKHSQVGMKSKGILRITAYLEKNQATLCLFFEKLCKSITVLFLDGESSVRHAAYTLILRCCSHMSKSQFEGFSKIIFLALKPMMTHANLSVNRDSLSLLRGLFQFHPESVINHTEILEKLLGMITTKNSNTQTRAFNDVMDNSMVADAWRREVFVCFKSFLSVLLGIKSLPEKKGHEVHWNDDVPMYLPLYQNSGPNPRRISYLWAEEGSSTRERRVMEFLPQLIPLLGETLTVKLKALQKRSDYRMSFEPNDKEDLLLFVEILSLVGEWVNLPNVAGKLDRRNLSVFQSICVLLMRGFPYHISPQKLAFQLNLTVSYLYGMYVLDSPRNSPTFETNIIEYFENVFTAFSKVPEAHISLILKFCSIAVASETFNPEVKDALLFGLHGILDSMRLRQNVEEVYMFFMKISIDLDSDYRYLKDTKAMETWFKSLLMELNLINQSGVSSEFKVKFLHYFRQLCGRKQPELMAVLNAVEGKNIISFLHSDDPDFLLAIISLIVSRDEISPDLFQDLAEFISRRKMPDKIAFALIRQLHTRYLDDDLDILVKLEFVKFLLHVAFDVFPILHGTLVRTPEIEKETFARLFDVQRELKIRILPYIEWESHRELYEVCSSILFTYTTDDNIAKHVTVFVKDLLQYTAPRMPVHTAIAIFSFHLRKAMIFDNDDDLPGLMYTLYITALMYMSFALVDIPKPQRALCSIQPLLCSTCRSLGNAGVIFRALKCHLPDFREDAAYHALRIIQFVDKNFEFRHNDRNDLYSFLQDISSDCGSQRLDDGLMCTAKYFGFA